MEEYSSKDLDHLGIVSAMCDEINLVSMIDQLIPPDPRAIITTGECIKLMVINGLGFTSRPLYLEAQFYASKPVERLLGRACRSENISDDRLGRALDCCYEYGCDAIFSAIALQACSKFNVNKKFQHLDTTSMSVQGQYSSGEQVPIITFGHSKDYRPDLKKFMISLICSQDGDVPLLAQALAGNTSDKSHFRKTLKELKSQIKDRSKPHYFVADSAMYTTDTLKDISNGMKWVTRVPEQIGAAYELVSSFSKEEMEKLSADYWAVELGSIYAGIPQRWLLVYSEQAFIREKKTLDRQIEKELQAKVKELKQLASKAFDCEKDAKAALKAFEKKLKYHRLDKINTIQKRIKQEPGRPKKEQALSIQYRMEAALAKDEQKISNSLQRKGKFILATNELNAELLSNEDLLDNYKGQQSVERGFRFLKDPLFMASSVFLKNEQRIIALAMIMCLCLLVYTLTQRHLRQQLEKLSTSIPNQLGKPTKTPTMRWIFQVFEGVHLLIKRTPEGIKELILNLNPNMKHILQVLGPPFQKLYANGN
ncbi:hypothetical protein NEOC84_001336|uniref:IS1634 family transposase n=3 Tax=unclassified Neochlamydia TaxID=2643326 RepID=UPI00140A954D|nr:IS1634 family transposase [Neochlamydia sp. AcF84]NGY95419.1 hypothetical protein [Neochlamydia sp. AcF84]